ncbi:hypothetical protein BD626DRAFT_425788 [Schizophyllum amplum]|uniref:RRM domain-containing protein n=1 Tax=Schizophyllum amplum TaxID=97359 RepID=A0A550CVB4_9AGAR|nr:hypothetical protein BD626DRAFT_425788 [Auriculariopsis ampla]
MVVRDSQSYLSVYSMFPDLYGNDEGDVQDETAADAKPADTSAAEDTPAKPSTSPSTVNPPSSTYAPPTQQIQTYEESTDQYRDKPARTDNVYQQLSVPERSVRPSEMKDEGKMFIGGLNWDTTDDTLRAYFEQFGKVDACTIMRDAAGRSRCFAFLTFDDPASVNAVMVKEHTLDGKIIDPKRAIPRQEHQRATKLFIGGLPGSVTSESMRAFFSQFGKVIDSTVMLDRETGRSKGFGFISFEDTDVQPFLGFGNLAIDGKLIDVKLAQPRHQREQMQEEGTGGVYGRGASYATGANGGMPAPFAGAPQQTQQQSFDPQALAQLYTRMLSQISPMMGGGVAGGGMGMMGGAGGMGGAMGGMGGGPGMGAMGGGAGMGMGAGMGNPAMSAGGMGGGMGRGGVPGRGGHSMAGVPRGPRNMGGGAGVGPQRPQRGQHNFHPYAR